jgi:REP element-mobilizing transposase RayT
MGRSRYRIFEKSHPYFLTCTVVGWLPVFTRKEAADIILDSWRFLQRENRLPLFGYVILENHLHWIASGAQIDKDVGDFKSFTSRKTIDLLRERRATTLLRQLKWLKARHKSDREFQFWQEGSHPQLIEGDDMMWQKLEYIHNNPVKRGYVDDPTHWRCSSARNYAGQAGVIEVVTDWM